MNKAMHAEKRKGTFIVFEGLDASGTSTQAKRLFQYLIRKGRTVHLTNQPSSGPVGQTIRHFHSGRVKLPKDDHIQNFLFATLFAADRCDHLYNPSDGIELSLSRGQDVISTRFKHSSFAYNVETAADLALVKTLNDGFRDPDILIYLDIPVAKSLERIKKERPFPETPETQKRLRRARKNYERLLSNYKGQMLKVDALLSEEHIEERIVRFVNAIGLP